MARKATPLPTKAETRDALRRRLIPRIQAIADALAASAVGLTQFEARNPLTGEFEAVEDFDEIDRIRQDPKRRLGVDYHYLSPKFPNVQAANTALAYVADKPSEPPQQLAVTGTLKVKWDE